MATEDIELWFVRGSISAKTRANTDLERLDEGPQQYANGVALSQQFDETRRAEQTQEAQTDEVVLQHTHNRRCDDRYVTVFVCVRKCTRTCSYVDVLRQTMRDCSLPTAEPTH